jgi:hypothetical protein
MANKNTFLAEILAKQRFRSRNGLNQHSRNDRARKPKPRDRNAHCKLGKSSQMNPKYLDN